MLENAFGDMAETQRQVEANAAPSSRPTSSQVMQNSMHLGEFNAAFENGVGAFAEESAVSLADDLDKRPGVTDRLARAAQAQAEGRPRSAFKGKLRQHAGTQTLEEEVGDLKQLRRTVAQTSQSLDGLGEQIATAASSASREYALKVEEKVKQVQDAASKRLSFVEKKYEKALLLARQAAGTERAHDLERTQAAQAEEIAKLRKEYEARHVAEIAHTIEERDTYKHKYEEQKEGLQRLNKEHKELVEEMSKRLVSKEEFDSTCAERDQLMKDLQSKTKEFNRAKLAKEAAVEAEYAADKRCEAAEIAAKKAKREAGEETAAAVEKVASLTAHAERQQERMNALLAASESQAAESRRELEHERQLRSIVSDRQSKAIEAVVKENARLKERLRQVLRNTQPGHGSWEQFKPSIAAPQVRTAHARINM